MDRRRNVSRAVRRSPGGGGIRTARVSKKDAGDPARGPRSRAKPVSRTAGRAQKKAKAVTYGNVFDAISGSAEQSASLTARAQVMRALQALVKDAGWTQAKAAERLGVSQPRMNDLLRGRLSKFSLDALVNLVSAAGRRVHVELEAVE
jgi:predicted XRE-type DNA-binding protein